MRLRSVVAVLIAFITLSSFAQQRETIEVRLIEVDAVVTDRDGNPIHGLTADDFELFENGKRQAITNFAEYRETESSAAAASTPATTTATISRPAPRTMILFVDSLPVRGGARTKLFDSLRSLVARTIRPGDRVQVVTWSDTTGFSSETQLTGDRAEIERAIASVETGGGIAPTGPTTEEYARFFTEMAEAPRGASQGAQGSIEATQRFAAERELALMRRKTAVMQRIVSALAQSSGRSMFVYVSEVFPAVAGTRANTDRRATPDPNMKLRTAYTTRTMLEGVIAAANANGVSFYALRPEMPSTAPLDSGTLENDRAIVASATGGGGLETVSDQLVLQNEIEALSLVAEQTGGTLGIGPRGVDEVIERVVRDAGSYYTLAYRAASDGSDRERRIEVRAKNRGHIVRTRKAVVEKSDRTRARDLVLARLFERGPSGDLPFEIKAGTPVSAGRNRVQIPIEVAIPAERLQFDQEGNELAAKFTVLALAGASLHATGEITEQSQRITAPLGTTPAGAVRYRFELLHDRKPTALVIAVFDEKSGQAGARRVTLDGTSDPVNVDTFTAAKEIAARDHKPILVFRRPDRCGACNTFEKNALAHPVIARRLDALVFITERGPEPMLVLFDRGGTERAKWTGVPREPAIFGAILDSILNAAPNLERAVTLAESGPYEGEVELAVAFSKLGRGEEARAAVARAIAHGSPRTQQFGRVANAMLMVADGKQAEAMKTLDRVIAEAISAEVKATAWLGIGSIQRRSGAIDAAIRAYTTAAEVADAGSEQQVAATVALEELRKIAALGAGALRLVPLASPIVTGRHAIKTNVSSTEVARVVFTIDGAEEIVVDRPPFSTTVDFGRIPQTKTIRAVAQDAGGRELGRDALTVNHAGEQFWLRMTEPREGVASGTVRVSTAMRTPAGHEIKRVVLSWNDAERVTMTTAPWQADVDVPKGELGILRAVAELDDGRTAEDAVLLNATGYVERADVPLVELPVTISDRNGPALVKPEELSIREGKTRRAIESLTSGAEAPLTVGVVIDASSSMLPNILDVQEAAIRFLETILGDQDRAFLIAFNHNATLLQAPTSDRALVSGQIMSITPQGDTALHDAMVLGLMQFEGVKGRRALVVFSDGADTSSRYKPADVEELARRSNIPIYLIASRPVSTGPRVIPNPQPPAGRFQNMPAPPPTTIDPMAKWAQAYTVLAHVAESTGGDAHMLKGLEELPEVYDRIAAALRGQMLVMIRTDPGKSENDWRRIDVDVEGRGLRVRAPAGYYAPW